MADRTSPTILLFVLSFVFTAGLTFASLELPYLVDQYLIDTVRTPDIESRTGEGSEHATEIFIRHYHLRTIGYLSFFLTLILIGWGFATRRGFLAALGALGLILPMFAQFAGVMFFLAGLGMLNLFWLPVLDVAWDIPQLGSIIRAPFDIARSFFGLLGLNVTWPLIYLFIAGGLFIFLTSSFTWLRARSGDHPIARSWLYRYSRHPQYLGWIVWTYGLYLLILQARYPKRSWGIDASLSWLLATMVIIGVAMLEELTMKERSKDDYEEYRAKTPFLFPVPHIVDRIAAFPLRIMFRTEHAERPWHVAAYISLLTISFVTGSWFFYGPGLTAAASVLASDTRTEEQLKELAERIRATEHPRVRYHLAFELAQKGAASLPYFELMLDDSLPSVRAAGLDGIRALGLPEAVPAVVNMIDDSAGSVRETAVRALAELGGPLSIKPLLGLCMAPDRRLRITALNGLARMAVREAIPYARDGLQDDQVWYRRACINALASLRAYEAEADVSELLSEESVHIRRAAALALSRIGSEESRPVLTDAMRDEDPEVRLYAEEALRTLHSRQRE